jgi:hypothetical protein
MSTLGNSDVQSSLARHSPTKKSQSKGKVNPRKDKNQSGSKSSGKGNSRRINERSKNKPSFFERLYLSSLSWSSCNNLSVAKRAYDPSELKIEKYNQYEKDDAFLSPCKNFGSSKKRDSPGEQTFDEGDDKSIDLGKMYPVEDTVGGTSSRKSHMRPILKYHNQDMVELSPKESPESPESSRRYLGQSTFRGNPLVNSRSSSHNHHSSGRPPLPVSVESSSSKHVSRQLYLIPEALGGNQHIPLGSSSFDDENALSDHTVPVNIYKQQMNLSLQNKRNVEDDEFRLAISFAEEEMAMVQYHSSVTKSMSLSFDQCSHPPPPYSAPPSISHHTNHSSAHASPYQLHSRSQGNHVRQIASFSPPSSPKSALNSNHINRLSVSNDAVLPNVAAASPSRHAVKQEPERDLALETALRLSMDQQAMNSPLVTPNKVRTTSAVTTPVSRPCLNHSASGSSKRNQIIEEANESAMQLALRASLQEAQKQRQRLEIREKLALSRALVASVDNSYPL